jgi:ATP-dependent Lon protease
VHFPEFVRKDGPSAGVTMATSLASALIRVPVKRDLAMTGEITLRGRVMPIGGVKEKLLAAHRSGITTVIVPRENRKDLREVPRRVLRSTRVVLVEHMDDVLREALCLPNPEKMFGPSRERWEYREGELVVIPAETRAGNEGGDGAAARGEGMPSEGGTLPGAGQAPGAPLVPPGSVVPPPSTPASPAAPPV